MAVEKTYFYGGSPTIPGTGIPRNVTGDCPHRHRSPETAQSCIDATDRAIKIGHGSSAYCDRIVMVRHGDDADADVAYTSEVWDG